jgi:hypothetical protein
MTNDNENEIAYLKERLSEVINDEKGRIEKLNEIIVKGNMHYLDLQYVCDDLDKQIEILMNRLVDEKAKCVYHDSDDCYTFDDLFFESSEVQKKYQKLAREELAKELPDFNWVLEEENGQLG